MIKLAYFFVNLCDEIVKIFKGFVQFLIGFSAFLLGCFVLGKIATVLQVIQSKPDTFLETLLLGLVMAMVACCCLTGVMFAVLIIGGFCMWIAKIWNNSDNTL